ncbi:MAG: hypothetical protein CSA25_02290, partial [Desulfobacter postgatei]
MRAISNEKCISEGKLGLQNLFEFVNQNAESMPAYEMEKNIFQLALKIALSGMKYFFAQKGTGDIGPELRPMIKIKTPICLSIKPPSALRQRTHISNMRLLACLDGDLKLGTALGALILIVGLKLENGVILKRKSRLHGKDYFSILGKFKVPRTCYRLKGFCGIMPLDAQADLPDRCYSYLLQET